MSPHIRLGLSTRDPKPSRWSLARCDVTASTKLRRAARSESVIIQGSQQLAQGCLTHVKSRGGPRLRRRAYLSLYIPLLYHRSTHKCYYNRTAKWRQSNNESIPSRKLLK